MATTEHEKRATRNELQELLLQGAEALQQRRQEWLSAVAAQPVWRVRRRVLWRTLRMTLHLLTGVMVALLSGLMFMPYSRLHRPLIAWWHRRLCAILNIRIRVHGTAEAGACLWVSNHVSWLDIPVLGALFSPYFLAKAEVASWPLLGSLAKASGTLFIRRGSGDSKQVGNGLAEHLRQGRSVLFFPEGTTTDGKQLKRFFHRLFQAAVKAGCPVQPVLLCYTLDQQLHPWAPFIGDDEILSHARQILSLDSVVVDVRILPRQQFDGQDARQWCYDVEAVMYAALQQLLAEVTLM